MYTFCVQLWLTPPLPHRLATFHPCVLLVYGAICLCSFFAPNNAWPWPSYLQMCLKIIQPLYSVVSTCNTLKYVYNLSWKHLAVLQYCALSAYYATFYMVQCCYVPVKFACLHLRLWELLTWRIVVPNDSSTPIQYTGTPHVPPLQGPPLQVPPLQGSLLQVPPLQVPSLQVSPLQVLPLQVPPLQVAPLQVPNHVVTCAK